MKVIRSRENALVKNLVRLGASSRERRRSATMLLDGVHLIDAYRDAHLGPVEVLAATESAVERPEIQRLLEKTPARAAIVLAESLLKQISQVVTPSGVLAAVRTPGPWPIPDRIEDGLFLEEIQDPGNLGSILRTALAAGLKHVFLSRSSVFAWSPKVLRAGMGAHFSLSIHEDAEVSEVAARAVGAIIATEPHASRTLYEADLRRPVLWFFGNEGAGLSAHAAHVARERVRIPMPGPVESLNLGASVAVCLFERLRQRA